MLSLHTARKPAPMLARGALWLGRRGGATAFGNAIGSSVAEAMNSQDQTGANARSALNKFNRESDSYYGQSDDSRASWTDLDGAQGPRPMIGGNIAGMLLGGGGANTVAAQAGQMAAERVTVTGKRMSWWDKLVYDFQEFFSSSSDNVGSSGGTYAASDVYAVRQDTGASASISADQGYITNMRNIMTSGISVGDKLSMAWGRTKYAFRGSETAQGTVQIVGGGFEVVGAAGLTSTGFGTALAVPLAFHGGDNIGTGFNRIFGVGDGQTVTYQGAYKLSGSSAFAQGVDQGVPFLAGVASFGQGLRLAEEQVLRSTTYRALTSQDAAALDAGRGLTAKAPNGLWSAEDHVTNFNPNTRGGAALNSPWISTTRSFEVAQGYEGGSGIMAINLGKVPNAQVEVWRETARSSTYDLSKPYHRSIWAQEVTVYQAIPSQAFYVPFNPLGQVSVYQPFTYGLTLGATGFINNKGGAN